MARKPSLPPLRPEHPTRNGTAENPWDTEDPSYAPDRFYTRATNERDHGEYRRVKFPPEVLSEIEHIVQSGVVPEYTSAQDLIRDAVIHRIRWLNDFKAVPLTPTGRMMMFRQELARIEHRLLTRTAILEDVRRISDAKGLQPADQETLVEIIRDRLAELAPEDRNALLDDIRRSAPLHVQQLVERAMGQDP